MAIGVIFLLHPSARWVKNRLTECPFCGAKECSAIQGRVIAACFAIVTFVAALAVGLASGNPPGTVIVRATVVMIICWIIGQGIGALLQYVIDDDIDLYKRSRPLPPMTPLLEEQEQDASDQASQAQQQAQSATATPP
jgi:hypothetical protein